MTSPSEPSEALRGHGAMLAFSALVAGSFTLGALVANEIEPLAFTAIRFWIAAALVGLAALVTRSVRGADLRAPWRFFLLGAAYSAYFVLMFEGLKTADPVSSSAVMTLMPAMTAIFAFFLLRQVTVGRVLIALLVGAVGALWVIFEGDLAKLLAFHIGRGEAVYFIGCVSHAFYVPFMRRMTRGESALSASFLVLVAAALVVTMYGFPTLRATDFASQPAITWITLAYTAIGATAVSFVLLNYASVRLPGAKVMAYTYLTPGWVILWELAFGRGLPPLWTLFGLVFSAIAIALLLKDDG